MNDVGKTVPLVGERSVSDTPAAAWSVTQAWRIHLAVFGVLLIATLALFHTTYWSMVTTWWRSETFAHGFIVVPISLYLIWRKRGEVKRILPSAKLIMLIPIVLLGLAWLLGNAADVLGVQQLATTLLFPSLVGLVFGWRMLWALAFPLAFLLLAVPIGEFLVPPLIDFTASFTVHALQWTGIPVYWEGNRFTLPSGEWSVVKACSGVRYLYATVTVALLYAYLNFNSRWRQIVFLAASVVLAIGANGIRAYAIVMIGHLSQMRLAVGIDHFIYGWVFFALLMVVLFWFGSLLKRGDREDSEVEAAYTLDQRQRPGNTGRLAVAGITGLVLLVVFPVWANRFESTLSDSITISLKAPPLGANWQESKRQISDWKPIYVNPSALLTEDYTSKDGMAGLVVAYYAAQSQDSELVNFRNVLAEEKAHWHPISKRRVKLEGDGTTPLVQETRLRSSRGDLLVWQWYWVNGSWRANQYSVKFHEALDKIVSGRRRGAGIVVYTPVSDDENAARERLQSFVAELSEPLSQALTHAESRVP